MTLKELKCYKSAFYENVLNACKAAVYVTAELCETYEGTPIKDLKKRNACVDQIQVIQNALFGMLTYVSDFNDIEKDFAKNNLLEKDKDNE